MPLKMSAVSTSLDASFPETYQIKTEQLYSRTARGAEEDLARRVGRATMYHGPARLNPQDLIENKPLPQLPTGGKNAPTPSPASLFLTRKKITDMSNEAKPQWEEGRKPRTQTPHGVTNRLYKQGATLNDTRPNRLGPPPKVPAIRLQKEGKERAGQRPKTVLEAERMANTLIRNGKFTHLGGSNSPFRVY